MYFPLFIKSLSEGEKKALYYTLKNDLGFHGDEDTSQAPIQDYRQLRPTLVIALTEQEEELATQDMVAATQMTKDRTGADYQSCRAAVQSYLTQLRRGADYGSSSEPEDTTRRYKPRRKLVTVSG